MPLFSVLCARVLLGERQTKAVYLSLVPIIVGVVIASATELSFSTVGLLFALCSTFTYALLNAFVKKVLQETGLHHVKLLSIIAQIACVFFLPIWCLHDVTALWRDTVVENSKNYLDSSVFVMLLTSGFLNFAQNLITFTLIHKLTALSYAVANCTKRLTIISASLLTLHNPVTPMNVFGMFLAALGVLGYNRVLVLLKNLTRRSPAKQGKRVSSASEEIDMSMPYSMSDPTFPDPLLLPSANHLLPYNKKDLEEIRTNSNSSSGTMWRKNPESSPPKNSARFYISTPMEEV